MPRRSDAYMAAKRREILKAAKACLLEKDWARTTIDDVAAAAGVSKGAVYTHFATKRDLIIGLIEANVEEIDTAHDIKTIEDFRADIFGDLAIFDGPQGRTAAIVHLELQLEGVRDPEIAVMLEKASDRLLEAMVALVGRLRPELTAEEARRRGVSIILLMEGARSYRAQSNTIALADLRVLIERELAP